MKRSVKIIFAICTLSILGAIALQAFWLKNYNTLSKELFVKEIETSFKDAMLKELQQRGDSIQERLYRYLIDTSQVRINSIETGTDRNYIYNVSNALNKEDKFLFSFKDLHIPLSSQADPAKKEVAYKYARTYRVEEFEKNALVYNRTSNLNAFLAANVQQLGFNADSLGHIYEGILAKKRIYEPFILQFSDKEKYLESVKLSDSLLYVYPYFTQPQPTHNARKDYNYVIALFKSPRSYLISRLTWQIASSGALVIIFGLSLYYLMRLVYREKKLSVIKNDFISNITHEFKTPIATAMAAIEALDRFDVLQNPERTKKYLAASKNEINRLSDLVNKILEISLYEKSEVHLKKETVNMKEILEALVANFMLINNKISLQLTTQCTVPIVRGDRIHLSNAISNIIDNAIKYSPGNPVITIHLSCFDKEVEIQVQDNGIGIPASSLPHIFEKFYRVPAEKIRHTKGFGLGLFYTQRIINLHGGTCKVKSMPGEGTVFKISLLK
jgi:two-component system, OmpR family, phosphate regulon sensor histidine kinase PhoR